MNKKAFTLVELLAVIVVLAVILVIAIPNVLKVIDKAKNDAYVKNEELMVNATRNYLASNPSKVPVNIGDISVIDLSELQSNNIMSNIKDPKGNTNCSGKVIVSKKSNNEYSYNSYLECGTNYKTYGDYITNGLVLNLDGYDAPVSGYWMDKSGNNNNGQMLNMAGTRTSGYDEVKKAYVFDGINDGYLINDSSSLSFPTELTIDMTFNTGNEVTSYANYLIYKQASTSASNYNLYLFGNSNGTSPSESGKIALYCTKDGIWQSPTGTARLSWNTTYNVVITWSNTIGGKIYVNGEQKVFNSSSASGTLASTTNGVKTSISNNMIFNSIRLYNRALTSDEILNNYNIDKQRYGL